MQKVLTTVMTTSSVATTSASPQTQMSGALTATSRVLQLAPTHASIEPANALGNHRVTPTVLIHFVHPNARPIFARHVERIPIASTGLGAASHRQITLKISAARSALRPPTVRTSNIASTNCAKRATPIGLTSQVARQTAVSRSVESTP